MVFLVCDWPLDFFDLFAVCFSLYVWLLGLFVVWCLVCCWFAVDCCLLIVLLLVDRCVCFCGTLFVACCSLLCAVSLVVLCLALVVVWCLVFGGYLLFAS